MKRVNHIYANKEGPHMLRHAVLLRLRAFFFFGWRLRIFGCGLILVERAES